jgi:nucleotide-binding universal stress UspA family protein
MNEYACIAAGIDFRAPCAAALRQAIRMAERASASLHVVHVIDTLVVMDLERSLAPEQKDLRDGLRRDALKEWSGFAKQIPGADRLALDIVIDSRSVGLVQRASSLRADLLVVGAYASRDPDVGPGTVATACVRESAADVLLVREDQPGPFRVVLAATDLSAPSRLAVARAAQIAAQDGAELHLLHVLESPRQILGFPLTTTAPTGELRESMRAAAENALMGMSAESQKAHPNLVIRAAAIDGGVARRVIPEHARSLGAELVVLGAKGRGGLREFVLGSTAEAALRRSHASVLVVRESPPRKA